VASCGSFDAAASTLTTEPTEVTEIVEQVLDDSVINQIALSDTESAVQSRREPHSYYDLDTARGISPHAERTPYSSSITADDEIPPIEIFGPDYVSLNEGDEGVTIDWEIFGNAPGYYWVYQDGEVFSEGEWDYSGYVVTIFLDGLPAGNYVFDLDVGDSIGAQGWFTTYVDVQILGSAIEIYGPDYISFNEGEYGWMIDWEIYGEPPGWYWVYQNGEVLFGGDWEYSGYMVSVNLDGLPAGNYVFDLDVGDSMGSQGWFTTFVDVWGQGQGVEIYGPDYLSFNEGELGWTIDWEIYGSAPGHYWVYQNGDFLFEGEWEYSGYIVTVDLDGVPLGNYIYQIYVEDANYVSGWFDTFVDIWSPFPMIIGPEEPIYLMYGDTGYSIVWEIYELEPLHYEVQYQTEIIMWETWWENTTVTVSLDGLSPGQHWFSIRAVGMNNEAWHSVEVYVESTIPPPSIIGPETYSFTEGETGNSLTYSLFDAYPSWYAVLIRSDIIIHEWWYDLELDVSISLDDLGVGEYPVRVIAVNEMGLQSYWTTIVTVYPQPGYTLHGPIWIENDFDFENYASTEGWSGDGSEMNPFVIENYVIISDYLCIYLGHTSYHYIISNCIFTAAASGYYTCGIDIEEAPYGVIESCRFLTSESIQIDYSDGIMLVNNEFHGDGMNYGVFIGSTQFAIVENNRFIDFSGALYLMDCYQAEIVNNDYSDCYLGILIQGSFDCVFTGNTFDSGGIFIEGYWLDGYWHQTFIDNYINGKPIGFFFDLIGVNVDVSNYAQLLIFNCTDSQFYNGLIENVGYGVLLSRSQSCTISNLVLDDRTNMMVDQSVDCMITNIICMNMSGFYVRWCQNVVFQDCIVMDTSMAFTLYETQSILISESIISNCEEGIQLHHCDGTIITDSSFILNAIGIDDVYNTGTAIYNSIFEGNTKYAIYSSQSEGCVVTHCTFTGNYYGIFIIQSMNCYVYHNQFFSSLKSHGYDYGPYPSNFWDDGISVGNTWDDYGGTGWYYIPGHGMGVDHYPCSTSVPTAPTLDSPADISFLEGQYSGSILWNVFDDNPDYYEIWLNGYPITQADWMPDEVQVFVELAGLTPGTYEYTLILYDEDGLTTSDTVIVTVYPDTTPPEFQYYWGTLYYFGDIDNFVVWGIYDENPLYYEIYVDGMLLGSNAWNEATFEVVLNVDGLEVGVHQYELKIYAIGGSANAWVEVIVLPDTVPVVTSPEDISCYYESTNNAINWEATDPYLSYYLVMMNGIYYDGGEFTSTTETITVNIDGLDLGIYEFTLLVSNEGANTTDTVIVTVMMVPPHVESYMTNNDDKVISTFDVMFKKACDGYELFHTNPNKMVYNIEFINIWSYDLGTLMFSVKIPTDFCLRGDSPISVYVDGIDATASASIIGTEITIYNIASGSNVTIRVMVDYALKGSIFESVDDFLPRSYRFEVATSESGEIITTQDYSKSSLVSNLKHVTAIAGFVMDANCAPIENAVVELYDSEGNLIASTITDFDGFYYFTAINAGSYTVVLYYNETEYDSVVEAANNQLTLVEFIILENL